MNDYESLAWEVVKQDAEEYNTKCGFPLISIPLGEIGWFDYEYEVYHSEKSNLGLITCISLDHDPYFKVVLYNENDCYCAVCRIYWDRPEYVAGVDSDIRLTKEQITDLFNLFQTINKSNTKSNWNVLIEYFNMLVDWYNEEPFYDRIKKIEENLPIPNYYKLLEEV